MPELAFGHTRRWESVLSGHLAGLCEQVDVLPGAEVRAFLDIDSLPRVRTAVRLIAMG